MKEIRSLTALRGVAALWVFGFHLWLVDQASPTPLYAGTPIEDVFRHGWTGVDLFFALSGFILARVHSTLSVATAGPFFLKRIFRIYPLHIAVTLLLAAGAGVAALLGLPVIAGRYELETLPAALLLTSFSAIIQWNSVTWSLAVELFCYGLMPVLLPMLRRLPRQALLLLAIVLATTASLWISALDGPSRGVPALLRGMLGFYLGCCVALAWAAPARAGAWAACALAGMAIACATELPGLVALCAAVLVGGLSAEHGVIARLLRTRPALWLGHVSFSIYLLHMPVLTAMQQALPLHRIPLAPEAASLLRDAVSLGIVLALSALSYRFIELPGQALPRRWGLLAPPRPLAPMPRGERACPSGALNFAGEGGAPPFHVHRKLV